MNQRNVVPIRCRRASYGGDFVLYGQKWAIVGGDERQVYLADRLGTEGLDVARYCIGGDGLDMDMLAQSRLIVLPMPATDVDGYIRTPLWEGRLEMSQLSDCLEGGDFVFAGKVGGDLTELADRRGFTLIDYLEREELAVLNAISTAEGALAIALQKRPETLFGAHVLLTGMGRISKVLLKLLVAFGARLTVAARKPQDRVWAQYGGARAIGFDALPGASGVFDIIFNTVPQLVITDDIIALLKPDCLIIDLASKPGGVDFVAAERGGIATEWALALPGKVAPKSAADAIYTAIMNSLYEAGML